MGIFFSTVKNMNEVFISKLRQCFETCSCTGTQNKEMKQVLCFRKEGYPVYYVLEPCRLDL